MFVLKRKIPNISHDIYTHPIQIKTNVMICWTNQNVIGLREIQRFVKCFKLNHSLIFEKNDTKSRCREANSMNLSDDLIAIVSVMIHLV